MIEFEEFSYAKGARHVRMNLDEAAKWMLIALATLILSCAVAQPTQHDPVIARLPNTNVHAVMAALEHVMALDSIPIHSRDFDEGLITTDSFEVKPEYADCGLNLFGSEYPGTRRGQMRITIKGSGTVQISFRFATLLTILTNNKQVVCTSFGTLENRILEQLEKQLGIARLNAKN